ncbi:MAG TPA: phosphoribosylanthranilate isomerase [Syntrophales bacterium]|nr:phosphoribosylanthranilate isomerase [Syntrophales bacterium]
MLNNASPMEIKICGITNLEDAADACAYGADALGFIFYKKSQRYITPETAKHIIENISNTVVKVGVFVNHEITAVRDIYEFCGLDLIQLHGDESPEYCRQFPETIIIKAFSPSMDDDVSILKSYPVKAILIDAREPGLYGGTGKKSNWEMASKLKEMHPLILSGGLNPDNILEAIDTVSPNAVDVCSGVEVSPGDKDSEKMKSIVVKVHAVKRKSPVKIFTKS